MTAAAPGAARHRRVPKSGGRGRTVAGDRRATQRGARQLGQYEPIVNAVFVPLKRLGSPFELSRWRQLGRRDLRAEPI